MSALADDMVFYREKNHKDFIKKNLLENKHSKDAEYKISIQKSIVLQYSRSQLLAIEIKTRIPSIIGTQIANE